MLKFKNLFFTRHWGKKAEKIINKGKELGRYNSVDNIMMVPGIGSKAYEELLSHIRIN